MPREFLSPNGYGISRDILHRDILRLHRFLERQQLYCFLASLLLCFLASLLPCLMSCFLACLLPFLLACLLASLLAVLLPCYTDTSFLGFLHKINVRCTDDRYDHCVACLRSNLPLGQIRQPHTNGIGTLAIAHHCPSSITYSCS